MAEYSPEQTSEMFRQLAESAQNYHRELDPLAKGSKDMASKAKGASDALFQFGKDLGAAAGQASKAMIDVKDGAGKYSSAFDTLSAASDKLGANMSGFGKVVTQVGSALFKLAGNSLKQNEALHKSYRALSDFGAVGKDFFVVLTDMQKAGFAIKQNSDEYIASLKAAAPGIATFAGSVNAGKKAMTETFQKTLNRSEKHLEHFGISSEEAFKRTGSYMTQLSLSSTKQKMTSDDLSKSSVRYMEALTGLAELTGKSRDEAEKVREAQMTDLRFQMKLNDIRKTDPEKAERLQDMMMATQMRYGKEAADGLKSMIVTNGAVVDDAAAKFVMMFGKEGYKNFQGVMNNSSQDFAVSFAELMKKNVPILQKGFDNVKETIMYGGNDIGGELGRNIDVYSGMIAGQNLDYAKWVKEWKDLKKGEHMGMVDANTERKRNEREVRNAYEKLEFNVARIAVPAVNLFARVVKAAAGGLANVVHMLGGPDMRSSFKNFENFQDAAEEASKQQVELNKLSKERIEIEKDIANYEDKRTRALKSGQSTWLIDKMLSHARGRLETNRKNTTTAQGLLGEAQTSARAFGEQQQADVMGANTMLAGKDAGSIEGLRIKEGDVHMAGAYVDPKLVSLAKQIQSNVGGFKYFSSFNDKFHQDRNSLHNKGKALDFVLDHWPDPSEGEKLAGSLRAMGFSKVIDEYNNPSSGATAGHIHAELQAKNGGIFSGPITGYNVQLHGDEMVTPMKKGVGVEKHPLSSAPQTSGMSMEMSEMMGSLFSKIDDLIDLQRRANSTREEILTHAKA